jgi:hypothetical protein
MRNEIRVRLDDDQEFVHDFDSSEAMSNEDGRRWLDQEFIRMECEALRASGKVLIVDKVVSVAKGAGAQLLGDAECGGAPHRSGQHQGDDGHILIWARALCKKASCQARFFND